MSLYLLFGAFLQRDPVFPIGAHVHLVGLYKVLFIGFLRDGALNPDGRNKAQETQIDLRKDEARYCTVNSMTV